ncbi:hypothetical protein TNIN_9131 [Trichonephila inaurata madagascariensis]|uniref:Uncharacterized protein n=1 Tax=Trichonephila inaurata madagascariensis TaxID=2747483 RepID=A0A8X6M792_9ARAC|nr:hypothetical protein TNIN_9131 [Trichonephila inaurata madagascariensis]
MEHPSSPSRQSRHSRQQGLQQPEQSQRNGRSDHHLLDKVDTPDNKVSNSRSRVRGEDRHHLLDKVDTPDNKVSNSRSRVKRNGRSQTSPSQTKSTLQTTKGLQQPEQSRGMEDPIITFLDKVNTPEKRVSNSRSRVRGMEDPDHHLQTKSTLQTTRSPTAGEESEEWKIRSSPS